MPSWQRYAATITLSPIECLCWLYTIASRNTPYSNYQQDKHAKHSVESENQHKKLRKGVDQRRKGRSCTLKDPRTASFLSVKPPSRHWHHSWNHIYIVSSLKDVGSPNLVTIRGIQDGVQFISTSKGNRLKLKSQREILFQDILDVAKLGNIQSPQLLARLCSNIHVDITWKLKKGERLTTKESKEICGYDSGRGLKSLNRPCCFAAVSNHKLH